MNRERIGYGLIGCGGFGRFCLGEYRTMPDLRCVAVTDRDPELLRSTAGEFGVEAITEVETLLKHPDIDIVHLATPPFTHPALAMQALQAGKHVLCEKPLALKEADAKAMVMMAEAQGKVLAVNLIMRYNPLCAAVRRLVESQLLGDPLHATLVNAAQDERLPAEHWFWDPESSGGIFIEHGVHFFDLFEWWFGAGEVVSAVQLRRPGSKIVDQVQCSVRYGESTLGTFYHGFHQMHRRDRQTWLLVFETGTVSLDGWVPTDLVIDMHGSQRELEEAGALIPGSSVEVVQTYADDEQVSRSRHRVRTVEVHGRIRADAGCSKLELYGKILRDLMEDQVAAIRDPRHVRRVTESNGVSSLAYALRAQELAEASG
ncbi:Gfo/Idh/MocA family protein [Luteolibacter luteus]|uniref:Gfo/Idh/MocA family oxidoreductase n=1 Tax=Luteolibacter luteus TaxID=2728835 RepID=A0A858REI1_9BACT|nr:Gfo/Idh/MocA family oxidoreductase [Luteolibacter luteus]QJE95135.1 Gfo/Idh/MocA family oxidoreductase [Luteolibacter luteus]